MDRTVDHPEQAPSTVRQPAIDGLDLSEILATMGIGDAGSSPLLEGSSDPTRAVAYLESLLGGPPEDPLRPGRIPLLYCGLCLDSSCGVLLAAALSIREHEVTWSAIGFETEHFGRSAGRGPTETVVPPPEWWTPSPFEPPIAFRFSRDAYTRAVEDELARLS